MSLQVRQLVKHFDGVKAVNGVSFEVHAGECVALIGPNGAGKSTLFACIAGQHALTAGEVLWAGVRLNGLNPALRLARGVARTFQVAQTFEALTVLQNVQLLLQAPHGLAPYSVLDDAFTAEARALLAEMWACSMWLTPMRWVCLTVPKSAWNWRWHWPDWQVLRVRVCCCWTNRRRVWRGPSAPI